MSDSKDWAALIPEFYYDLISRIPAGVILLSVVGLSTLTQEEINKLKAWLFGGHLNDFPFILIFIVLLCAGYIISIPLTMFGAIVRASYSRVVWNSITTTYSVELHELEKRYRSKADESRFFRLIHDELKQNNLQARVLLPKMSAEVSLCDNMTAAFLLASLFIMMFTMTFPKAIYFLLFFASFSFIGGCYRFHRLMARHISFAKIVKIIEDDQQSSPTNGSNERVHSVAPTGGA